MDAVLEGVLEGVLERSGRSAGQRSAPVLVAPDLPGAPRGPVVVGYDGSEPARRAVLWAARRVGRSGEPLVVLTASGTPGPSLGRLQARELVDEGASSARRVAAGSPAGTTAAATGPRPVAVVRPVGVVRPGRASEALLLAADRAALLVVGSRGAGALPGAPLGAVSTAVAARARCPVVVVHDQRAPEGDQLVEAPVVVAVDGSAASDAAVALAADEASASGCPLLVVAVWGEAAQTTWVAAGLAGTVGDLGALSLAQHTAADHARSAGRAVGQRHPGLVVRERVLAGPAVRALVDAAHGASLLVLGSRGLTGRVDLLRESVSTAVARRVDCPVAVVKAPPVL